MSSKLYKLVIVTTQHNLKSEGAIFSTQKSLHLHFLRIQQSEHNSFPCRLNQYPVPSSYVCTVLYVANISSSGYIMWTFLRIYVKMTKIYCSPALLGLSNAYSSCSSQNQQTVLFKPLGCILYHVIYLWCNCDTITVYNCDTLHNEYSNPSTHLLYASIEYSVFHLRTSIIHDLECHHWPFDIYIHKSQKIATDWRS